MPTLAYDSAMLKNPALFVKGKKPNNVTNLIPRKTLRSFPDMRIAAGIINGPYDPWSGGLWSGNPVFWQPFLRCSSSGSVVQPYRYPGGYLILPNSFFWIFRIKAVPYDYGPEISSGTWNSGQLLLHSESGNKLYAGWDVNTRITPLDVSEEVIPDNTWTNLCLWSGSIPGTNYILRLIKDGKLLVSKDTNYLPPATRLPITISGTVDVEYFFQINCTSRYETPDFNSKCVEIITSLHSDIYNEVFDS